MNMYLWKTRLILILLQFCAGKLWEVTFPVFVPFAYISSLKMTYMLNCLIKGPIPVAEGDMILF